MAVAEIDEIEATGQENRAHLSAEGLSAINEEVARLDPAGELATKACNSRPFFSRLGTDAFFFASDVDMPEDGASLP
ncbi:MAG: hypothetical protein ACXVRI_03770 [Gaiellaceae bacterium]